MPVKYYIVAVNIPDGMPGPASQEVSDLINIGLEVSPGNTRIAELEVHGPFPTASATNEKGQREHLKFTGYLRG